MRMRRANLSHCIISDDKYFSFNFTRNENQFFACDTLIPHEQKSYTNKPEIIIVLPLNSKIIGHLLLHFFFFFVHYISNLYVPNELANSLFFIYSYSVLFGK